MYPGALVNSFVNIAVYLSIDFLKNLRILRLTVFLYYLLVQDF